MYRSSLAILFVAAIAAAWLVVSPAAAQRSRPAERQTPESVDAPPARERPEAGPQAAPRGAQGQGTQEESEDGWPGGMQERSAAPGQPRIAPGFPPFPQSARWWLGVYAYNTSTGIVITRVVPNSPAARAGLEPRDRIVTVEGFQVGYLHRRLYALGPELQLRADPNGQVRLLVQNWRNGELTNMDARMAPSRPRTPDRPRERLEGGEAPQ
jgi:membrane-associated protease RseP (regulator of RpoE activity)